MEEEEDGEEGEEEEEEDGKEDYSDHSDTISGDTSQDTIQLLLYIIPLHASCHSQNCLKNYPNRMVLYNDIG